MYTINQEFRYKKQPVIKRLVIIQFRKINQSICKYETERIVFKETRGEHNTPKTIDFQESDSFKFVTVQAAINKMHLEIGSSMCRWTNSTLKEERGHISTTLMGEKEKQCNPTA